MRTISNFEDAFSVTVKLEGGFVNDPKDRGGRTYRGISEKHWPSMWKNGRPLDSAVADFYDVNFWVPLGCDYFHRSIAFELFDTAVNVGIWRASRFLQKAYNLVRKTSWKPLKVDGKLGPKSRRAIRQMASLNLGALVKSMNGYQFIHYEKLATGSNDDDDRRYIRGWIANRIEFEEI